MEELQRIKLPNWAVKPHHRQTVVATNKGWVVQDTGEILKRVNDLPRKLEMLKQHMNEVMIETFVPIDVQHTQSVTEDFFADSNSYHSPVSDNMVEEFVEHLHDTVSNEAVESFVKLIDPLSPVIETDVTVVPLQESVINTDNDVLDQPQPKKRGRKPGSKKKVESDATETHEETNS